VPPSALTGRPMPGCSARRRFRRAWIDGKSSVSPVCNLVNCETKDKWLATLRGRIGFAADRVLFYATGARVEYLFVDLQNSTFTPVPAVPVTVKFNANLIRVGLDYKFNH
jgi:hypothetical protein